MPYKPNQVDEHDRSRAYGYMWFAVAGSVVNLVNAFLGQDNILFAFAWGFTMGGLTLAAIGSHADEFLRARLEIGMRFAMGALALYLFAGLILNIADIGHSAGYALATGETDKGLGSATPFLTDAQTLAAVIAATFHAGYVFAVVREG